MNAELSLDAKALLGEGAVWDHLANKLYWVDIEAGLLNVYDPLLNVNNSYHLNKRVGAVVPIDCEKVLLALEDGIALFNLADAVVDYKISTDLHYNGMRFNDGKCDAMGRFWIGTMSLANIPNAGSLYSIENGYIMIEKISNVSISNGIVWSGDHKTMYYIDTPTRTVVKYDYDLVLGHIRNREIVIEISENMGYPDGMTIDNQGMLWIALWDGFSVANFNPYNGKLMREVRLPVPKVTSCAFGGNNLNTLYITSASVNMTAGELEKYPLSGALFKIDLDVHGVPANYFRI